jgi:hypothetical protein
VDDDRRRLVPARAEVENALHHGLVGQQQAVRRVADVVHADAQVAVGGERGRGGNHVVGVEQGDEVGGLVRLHLRRDQAERADDDLHLGFLAHSVW